MTPPGGGAVALRADDQAARLRALVAAATAAPPDAQALRAAAQPAPAGPARIVAVASGKGGVGKTNLSVNLCAAFARLRWRAVLLDGDLGLANADVLCGVTATAHLGHVLDGTRTLEEILVDVPAGFRLAPGAAGLARFVDADLGRRHEILGRLDGLERGVDVVVIDCGAGIGPAVMSFVGAADLTLIVTTPEPTAVADAYALIKCAAAERARRPGAAFAPALVVNQARDAQDASNVHRRMSGVCERFLGFPLAGGGWIASDPHVPRAVRARRPFLTEHPRSRAARAVMDLAARVSDTVRLQSPPPPERGGLLARLFGTGGR